MGRKRKDGMSWLPQRVYAGKSAYEYRPKSGGCIRLAPLSASQVAVIRRYDIEKQRVDAVAGSVSALFDEYIESEHFSKLAISTRKKQISYAKNLKKPFGKMSCASLKPLHVRKWMDLRGKVSEVSANREFSFLSKAFNWGYERGKVPLNPCKGVRKFTETPRDRYIKDDEYQAVYNLANPTDQAIMEISYCCAARISDVLALTVQQLKDEGIYIKQGKTGKQQIKAWTDRLRAAIKQAQQAQNPRSMTWVIANKKGQPVTYAAFNSRWQNLKKKAKALHPDMEFDFTFHDNKARSISDWDGDKQQFSGHKSASQIATYDRKVPVVGSHE